MYGFHARKNLVFIDSLQSRNCNSLEKFVPNLPKDKFKYFKRFFLWKTIRISAAKGISPSEHMNGFEKSDETKLPKKRLLYFVTS